MSFFYDLNKKLDSIRATPEVTHQQLNERDMSRAAKGYEKYGREGMEALAKAGRDGKALDPVRKKYDKYDNKEVDEGIMDTVKSVGKKVASGINKLVGHGSDEDMRRDVQRKSGAPVTGKKPEQKTTEAAKYRDPKYKDKLYTQEPPDHTYGPDMDDAYDNPKPDDYAGRKRKMGGGEFPSTDPLASGLGIGRSGIKNNILDRGSRKGMPSRNQISSLKGSIKSARGTHAEPNLPEASGSIDYEKVLEAIAALYGDDMWENDAMGDLAQDLEQAGPTDRELDFIIAKGKLPTRLKGIRFTNTDDVQFGHLDEKSGDPMTAKQKSFAKLAPPADKITFADKIAGAKKEVDEMLGDVAAEAMRNALSPKQKKIDMNKNGKLDANDFAMLRKGGKPEMDEENDFTAHQRPAVTQPKVGSTERGHKHDIKHTATGRMVTRRTDPQGNSVGADDASDAQAEPRGRGRPKGTKGAIGAKGPSGKSKLMTREGDNESSELKAAMMLLKKSGYKVTKAESTDTRDDHAERAGKKVTKDIESDEKKKDGIAGKKRGPEDDNAEKSGKRVTKDIEHDKKKEKEVDESTTSGSVATSTATKGSGGGMVGKGIYDSMNRELENMIAESMSINMSDSTEGGKSLTITATDEDALKLGMMLKNAGLGGGDQHGGDMHSHGEEACDTCGMQDCGCGDIEQAVDENAPDWPTNTEQADNNFGYAGGLNRPKTDVAGNGQSTVPVVATRPHNEDDDMRRMMEMAGIKQAELKPWEQTMKEDAAEDAADAENDAEDAEAETEVQEDFLESIQRMREIAGIKEAKKPDFLDMDKDGDKKEPMSKAVKDKEEKKVDESIFALTNQWQAYKG